MLGHPGETEEDINDTLSLIKQLSKHCKRRNYISINIVCPYTGTGYWDYANEKYGKFIDFYNESYKYYHQARPCVNLTDMDDQVFYSYIDRIKRFSNFVNVRHRVFQSIGNPVRTMRKSTTIEEVLSACEIIRKHDIELKTFFIVGFSQETEETLGDTVTAMRKVKCNLLTYSIFTPYPGTDSFELCKEY